MTTPEGKVKVKIRKWIDVSFPGNWRVSPRGGPFGKGGTPDDLVLWRGVFIAIEAKADDNAQVSELQLFQLKKIRAAGGVAAVVRGYDVEKLQAIKTAALEKVAIIEKGLECQFQ